MYNIFSTKSSVDRPPLEGEHPPKKLKTEGDVLIKKLVENQLKTQSTLIEQLAQKKEFVASDPVTSATGHIKGETRLQDFQSTLNNLDERTKLNSKGLTDRDIEMHREFHKMGAEFWTKYKNINRDTLEKRLSAIQHLLQQSDNCQASEGTISRHQCDYISAVKPQSLETKLLKFVTVNNPQKHLSGPMDELPALEKQFMKDIEDLSQCNVKKIRKTARSLARRIESLDCRVAPANYTEPANLKRDTLWDVKELISAPTKQVQTVDKTRKYGCKPQDLYTVKDGTIIKLTADRTVIETGQKLSLNELKNIAKFSNYEAGQPSNVLFLKNISKCVTETFLRDFLGKLQLEATSIRVMTGKMKGQAFLEFSDTAQTTKSLKALNGVLVNDRPIVAQFGFSQIGTIFYGFHIKIATRHVIQGWLFVRR
ncbi:hypothetical protein D910_03987 [Dendroctonus ponderosae]|uniref:RRM domain-containing protein n=1 Tax=Dendroctonus ponderosae TaxID=77166 RepID=U4U9G8_DENPD|nr:hypothetical protein D910_03987 [Dendroctonus ponderosae]